MQGNRGGRNKGKEGRKKFYSFLGRKTMGERMWGLIFKRRLHLSTYKLIRMRH